MFKKIANKFKKKPDFPNDDDGDALRRLVNDGLDLSKPHNVDFFIVVPNESKCKEILKVLKKNGFNNCVPNHDTGDDGNEDLWDITYTKKIVITYDELITIQSKLDKLSKPYGGHSDGWGTFGG